MEKINKSEKIDLFRWQLRNPFIYYNIFHKQRYCLKYEQRHLTAEFDKVCKISENQWLLDIQRACLNEMSIC